MTWAAPRTWVVGEIVLAAYMNQDVRDNVNAAALLYDQDNAQVIIANDNAKTTIYSFTLTGGDLATFGLMRVVVIGHFKQNTDAGAVTLTITGEIGGTAITADNSVGDMDANSHGIRIVFEFVNDGGNVQRGHVIWHFETGGGIGEGAGTAKMASGYGVAAIDLSGDVTILVSETMSVASANVVFTKEFAYAEILRP